MMALRFTLAVLFFSGIVVSKAAAGPVEAVKLTPSGAIEWEGKSHQTLNALVIAEPVSIRLRGCADIIVFACELRSVELIECRNVTICNCWIHDSDRNGVQDYKSQQLLVQGCRFENVATGVYAVESRDVQVVGNFARNVQGPFPRGQLVQFDTVTGRSNVIRANYAINDAGKSHPEDVINLFKSVGEPDAPIIVEDNYLAGDPSKGSAGKSESGSGIMLADLGGAYQLCRRNVVVSAGQCGIGVAGGHHIRVEGNLIYGGKSDVSNVGLYIWNQSKAPSDHVTLLGNRVHWINHDGEENSWWAGGGIEEIEQKDNHFADTTLPAGLPRPPSVAPMPPEPVLTPGSDGKLVARLPWKPDR